MSDEIGFFGLNGDLYGMIDAGWGDVERQAAILAAAGVRAVQLRCKGWGTAELVALGGRVRRLWPGRLCLIVNDDVAAARALGAMVHLGQGDGPDPDIPFGRSTHDPDQARSPGRAAYIGFGPVYASTTKAGAKAPRGVAALAEAVRASPVPVVAIGGIDVSNVAPVRAAGAAGWAVIGGIWGTADPAAAVAALRGPGRSLPR